jgi:crotonobetainyl-CoA:carnitine CoA-transferase CaiB-like acyl-CoA transferase
MSDESDAVLNGVRVLDFGRYVAGPYCATLLGYLGADVIRVEKREGSEDRYIAPICEGGEGGVFFQTSCNKRSLTLDPASSGGREVARRLVSTADVVVANLPAASLVSLGLDYPTLSALNPRIILASQSAFGDAGPYARRGGFDGVGQAMSGAMHITGTPGHPAKAAAPYVDYSTAVLSAFGVMAALMERARSGRGQHVQAALHATALAVFGSHLIEQGVARPDRVGTGNRVQTSAPSDVFATRDGHVLTHVVGNGLFRRWVRLVSDGAASEEARWLADPRFVSDSSRGEHSAEILARMRDWCAARTTADALATLDAAGLPSGPVYTPQQALDDPQAAAMGWFHEVADFPGLPRPAPVPDLPLRFSSLDAGISRRPPLLGEHTDSILAELGYSSTDIAGLRIAGAI